MNNIVIDFRHNYVRGEQLQSQEVVYQYDTGRVLEAYVPETETSFFVHVGFGNDTELSVITTDSVTSDADGGYKILATIPDSILAAKYGTLLVFIVAADGNGQIVTTYEGHVPVKYKAAAEDYVVPDEEATSIIERATLAATAAEAAQTAAETAQEAAETAATHAMASTPEGYEDLVDNVTQLNEDLEQAIEDFAVPTQEAVNNWLTDHPEATTTVQENSLTYSKLATSLKSSVIPKITDFGGLSLATINNIIADDNVSILRCTGALTINSPIIIDKPMTLICDNFEVTQSVWGYPAIIILSDNVNIYGNITLICSVETRNAVTNSYYEDDIDKKSNSTGIMLGHGSSYKNFYAECVSVKNFISGVCNLSVGFTNVIINYLYVENVDFGVFGAHYIEAIFNFIEFKNIASYVGSSDPSHVVYLTGGSGAVLSESVVVNYIYGTGCNSKNTDSLISVKSTSNFACNGGAVKNVSYLCAMLNGSGYVKNIVADNASGGIGCQLQYTDFVFENIKVTNISIGDTYLNYCTTGAKMTIKNCSFNVVSDGTCTAYTYISTQNGYNEIDCEYIAPSDSAATLYKCSGTLLNVDIETPKTNIPIYTQSGTTSFNQVRVLLDPSKLSYPKTNTLVPGVNFVPNDFIVDEPSASVNYPLGFRTNDKVRVTNATGIRYFNTANVTNGVVYTLINGGGSIIQNGARIVTKSGGDYLANGWAIFRFMNIGNVAYEV